MRATAAANSARNTNERSLRVQVASLFNARARARATHNSAVRMSPKRKRPLSA